MAIALTLEPVTPENYDTVIALDIRDDQRGFVRPVVNSLAESYVWKEDMPRAARVGDDIVGFALVYAEAENGVLIAQIVRILIDKRFQGRGYGRALMNAVIDWIGTLEPRPQRIRIGAKPENFVALALYRSLGFTGEDLYEGEVELWRDV